MSKFIMIYIMSTGGIGMLNGPIMTIDKCNEFALGVMEKSKVGKQNVLVAMCIEPKLIINSNDVST